MESGELRDLEQARRFLLEGLWLQRVTAPTAATVRPALEWALEVAAGGQPLPPVGFLADLGHAALGSGEGARSGRETAQPIGFPGGLGRTYEDHVLGRVYADWQFERAGDALRRYHGRDRARGLAFVVNQMRDRAGFPGVYLGPAVIKGILEIAPEEVLARGWDSLARDGALPLLVDMYQALIAATRRTADLLGAEDIFELEHGTALAELGQRVALRQVLQATQRLEAGLPPRAARPPAGRREIPTRILDEDVYPVGGYSSVSTRGSIESMLHSQLAYMEDRDRPDLFDVKFLRDELLYYARDENQFLRRRRTFVFALFPDLMRTRFKDPELPWQRCVLWLGLLVATVRRLTDWLSSDALTFEFALLDGGNPEILKEEQHLLEMLLRESIANGTVRLTRLAGVPELETLCTAHARRSLCHCLSVVAEGAGEVQPQDTTMARLRISASRPELTVPGAEPAAVETDESLESWCSALEALLHFCAG
jgi:hypothetical protein